MTNIHITYDKNLYDTVHINNFHIVYDKYTMANLNTMHMEVNKTDKKGLKQGTLF